MIVSKVPPRFAMAGWLIGFVLMGLYWYDYKYNPFHLPPTPAIYHFLERVTFFFCPGLLLQLFTIGTTDRLGWGMWLLAVLLNGPIYYVIGLVCAAILKGGSRLPPR